MEVDGRASAAVENGDQLAVRFLEGGEDGIERVLVTHRSATVAGTGAGSERDVSKETYRRATFRL